MVLQAEPEARTRAQLVAERRQSSRAAGLGRPVYLGVAAVVSVQAAVIGWYAAHSWFFVDDFIFLRQAKDDDLSVSFLRLSLFEHFSPVHRIADWLLIRGAGPSWAAAATVLVALTVGCTLAFAYLISSITRDGRVIVLTTAVYAWSLFFARTSIWWTAGVHILSVTLFSMLALGGYVRWHQRRSKPALVLSMVTFALALLTHEDALLLGGVLLLLRLLVLAPQPRSVRDCVRAVREEVWVWVFYAGLTVLALWNFAAYYWQQHQTAPTVGELVRYMWMAVGEGFFATLFLVKVPEAMVHSPALTGGLALGAGLLVIAATLVTRVGAWRPWLFFALAFLATALPIGLSRIPLSGVTIGRDPVYQLRPAFLFLFAIVAACNGRRRFPAARAADAWRNAHPGVFVALACVAAVVVFGVYLRATSRVVHRGQWQAGATRQYFANLKGDVAALRARGIRPTVFSPDLPDAVVPAWVAPYNRLSINLMVPSIPASAADPHYRVAPDGHLQRVDFDEQYRGPISPATAAQWDWGPTDGTGCMAPRPGAGPLTVVLPKPLDGGGFLVRVQVRTRDPVAATVYADNDAFPTTLTNGSNDAFFDLPTVSQVGFTLPPGAACIEQVAVGTLVPAGR